MPSPELIVSEPSGGQITVDIVEFDTDYDEMFLYRAIQFGHNYERIARLKQADFPYTYDVEEGENPKFKGSYADTVSDELIGQSLELVGQSDELVFGATEEEKSGGNYTRTL